MDDNSTVDQLTFAYDGTAREEPQARCAGPAAPATCGCCRSPTSARCGRRSAAAPTPALKRKTLSGTAKKELGQAEAETLARAATSADAISGSGSLDVNRHGYILRPRELVGVRGVGRDVRRRLLRQVRHAQPPARLVPAELHALPRGADRPQRPSTVRP